LGATLKALARPWRFAVGLTLVGGITGGVLHAVFAPEKVRIVYVDRPAGEGSTKTIAAAASGDREAATLSPSTAARAATVSSSVETSRTPMPPVPEDAPANVSSWSKERALLENARRALGAGEPEVCLFELGKHARAFPTGRLAEEREALAINALVGVGRYTEARQKADLFARRYRHSFLAPSVEAAISAIP